MNFEQYLIVVEMDSSNVNLLLKEKGRTVCCLLLLSQSLTSFTELLWPPIIVENNENKYKLVTILPLVSIKISMSASRSSVEL